MAAESERLDYWRKFFRTANSTIFEVIEQAILVAAADSPAELRRRRDQIAVVLFSSHLPICRGCDNLRQTSLERENYSGDEKTKRENMVASNYSYDEAEALTEEIEEEGQMIGEVLRIKEVLFHKDEQSDSVLFESLRRLQLMALSVEILKATEIGKAVNGLRKHSSKQIRALVRTLIDGWKNLVDEWVSTTALTESTPESVNPSVVDDGEGLPSPPLDDGILFSAEPNLELSQFFDGMDDDGNIKNGGELKEGRGAETKPGRRKTMVAADAMVWHVGIDDDDDDDEFGVGRSEKMTAAGAVIGHDGIEDHNHGDDIVMGRSEKMTGAMVRHVDRREHRPVKDHNHDNEMGMRRSENMAQGRHKKTITGGASGPGRPQKAAADSGAMAKKPLPSDRQDKRKSSEEMSVMVKLEAAKRKLHEGYQQAENAKKQRTIQVMELQDIPRQGLGRHPTVKQGSLGRLRGTHGRR